VISKRVFKNYCLVLAAAPVLCTGAGCYQYQAYDSARIQPGQVVRVELAPGAGAALASTIGPNATTLDGRVLSLTPADVTVALTQITRSVGPEQFLHDEPVSLPLSSVAAFRVRAVDKPRTALAIGGIIAAVVAGQVFIDQSGIFGGKTTVSGSTK